MSSLRNQILSAAIPLVRNHSFTRPTLRQALANLPGQTSTEGGLDATLDTLFGPSPGSERELVKAWEKQGLENMQVTTGDQTSSDGQVHELQRSLQQRLQYSSESAGEHLVEALALLETPKAGSLGVTLPFPRLLDLVHTIMDPLPAYHPPEQSSSSSSDPSSTINSLQPTTSGSRAGYTTNNPSGRPHYVPLPLPPNPLRVLAYGFRIADQAIFECLRPERSGRGGLQQLGQETGGLDWYVRRLVLGMIYLKAESHLLYPRTPVQPESSLLEQSHTTLANLMTRYHQRVSQLKRLEQTETEVGQFGWFVYKSFGGLARSRGWIK